MTRDWAEFLGATWELIWWPWALAARLLAYIAMLPLLLAFLSVRAVGHIMSQRRWAAWHPPLRDGESDPEVILAYVDWVAQAQVARPARDRIVEGEPTVPQLRALATSPQPNDEMMVRALELHHLAERSSQLVSTANYAIGLMLTFNLGGLALVQLVGDLVSALIHLIIWASFPVGIRFMVIGERSRRTARRARLWAAAMDRVPLRGVGQ